MASFLTPATVTTYLIVTNVVAFCAFGIDKMLAEGGRRRIAEDTLLWWAGIGGTAGAYAGRRFFRHKTRKQPFSSRLHTLTGYQVVALAGLGAWWVWG
jgi:uncharacterized membrane protein YsdA (DUF1294 family)